VLQAGDHSHPSVGEHDPDAQHLRRKIPVAERASAGGPSAVRPDADLDPLHVRLQPDRLLHRTGEPGRGAPVERRPEVLVEEPPELDPGLEQQRLPGGERRPVVGGRARDRCHGASGRGVDGAGSWTVNGPYR
jgi:hypothetical protein